MRLPPAFSDDASLQETYSLFRANGLVAIPMFAVMILLGRWMDVVHADEGLQARFSVMITMTLSWIAMMVGGSFLVEARRLQLWVRRRDDSGFGTMVAINLALVFTVVAINLIVIGLAGIGLSCWLAIEEGILL
jgi:hypothetical protein